jgi:predicted transcriptional regulator
MDELKKYMKALGVKDSDIETIDYKNYERTITVPIDSKTSYKTELTVTFNMKAGIFYKAIKLLESSGVKNLKKDDYNKDYYFTIEGVEASEELSAQNVQIRYEKIKTALRDINITHIDIKSYETTQNERINQKAKKYFVFNKIKIKILDFEHIGKIFTKAQELKMNINSDLHYSVSDEKRRKAIIDHESELFSKLLEKAERAIGDSGYTIGVPSELTIFNMDVDHQKYEYYDSGGGLVTNGVNSARQTQIAQDLKLDLTSDYEITVGIRGNFDIVRERR